jgi:hypothetical protein
MNPYEVQRRMAKACALADKAEDLGYTHEELEDEHPKGRETLAKMSGVKPPSRETWEMTIDLLKKRRVYGGSGGLDDPKFIQRLGAMAVRITETLHRHNVDSDEATQLSKREKTLVAKLSKADSSEKTFDLGKLFLEMRESYRMTPNTKLSADEMDT